MAGNQTSLDDRNPESQGRIVILMQYSSMEDKVKKQPQRDDASTDVERQGSPNHFKYIIPTDDACDDPVDRDDTSCMPSLRRIRNIRFQRGRASYSVSSKSAKTQDPNISLSNVRPINKQLASLGDKDLEEADETSWTTTTTTDVQDTVSCTNDLNENGDALAKHEIPREIGEREERLLENVDHQRDTTDSQNEMIDTPKETIKLQKENIDSQQQETADVLLETIKSLQETADVQKQRIDSQQETIDSLENTIFFQQETFDAQHKAFDKVTNVLDDIVRNIRYVKLSGCQNVQIGIGGGDSIGQAMEQIEHISSMLDNLCQENYDIKKIVEDIRKSEEDQSKVNFLVERLLSVTETTGSLHAASRQDSQYCSQYSLVSADHCCEDGDGCECVVWGRSNVLRDLMSNQAYIMNKEDEILQKLENIDQTNTKRLI